MGFAGHVRRHAVGYVALMVALGGTAGAAAMIGGEDVRDESLTGRDLKNRSLRARDVARDGLRGAQIRESSLGKVPAAAGADTAASADSADALADNAFFTERFNDSGSVGLIPGSGVSVTCSAGSANLSASFDGSSSLWETQGATTTQTVTSPETAVIGSPGGRVDYVVADLVSNEVAEVTVVTRQAGGTNCNVVVSGRISKAG